LYLDGKLRSYGSVAQEGFVVAFVADATLLDREFQWSWRDGDSEELDRSGP
jgi:hypothetical protein